MAPHSGPTIVLWVLMSVLTSSVEAQTNFFGDPAEYMVQGKPEAAARRLRCDLFVRRHGDPAGGIPQH